jgi:hypothetical protein
LKGIQKMLVLKFKPGQSLTLREPDGTESVIHFRACSKSGTISVALDIPDDTEALRSSVIERIQAAEACLS